MKHTPFTRPNKAAPSPASIYVARLQALAKGGNKAAMEELQGVF